MSVVHLFYLYAKPFLSDKASDEDEVYLIVKNKLLKTDPETEEA